MGDFDHDFFISRRGVDAPYAREIADVLSSAGYKVRVQDKDIPVAADFIERMHAFLREARDLVVVMTPDYLASEFTRKEVFSFLAAKLKADTERRLILMHCRPCEADGVFASTVRVNLVGIEDMAEREKLILDAAVGLTPETRAPRAVFRGVPGRLEHFTGREALLDELRAGLLGGGDGGGAVAVTQAALAGMGGVGKTMLAAEYAHRHQGAYAGVWWAQAETRAVLEASLADLAGRLDPQWAEAPDQAAAAQAALELIRSRAGLVPWLLVYDNVETPPAIEGLIPSGGAHLIVTTRFEAWPGARTDVGLFPRDVAATFLQERAERTDTAGADRLAAQLGDLPLALDHAAAFCRETGVTFDEYSADLEAFLSERPEGGVYEGRRDSEATVFGTFSVALSRATDWAPQAERLMDLLSVLGAEPVPLDLFEAEEMSVPDRAAAVGALARFGLLQQTEASEGGRAVAVHRLVALVARARAEEDGRFAGAVETATTLLAKAFPNDAYSEPARWPRCAELLPHVYALQERWTVATAAASNLLDRAGSYLHGRAAYTESEFLFREALVFGEEAYGRDHPEIAALLNNLANLLRAAGRYEDAEPLIREAIEIGEKTLSRDHPTVAIRLNVLALLLRQTGRYEESEPLFREAIEIGEKALSRDHPDVAVWLNNLANLLRDTGRPEEAELLFREAIEIGEKTLGRDHPVLAIRQSNLANLLRASERHEEAEPLYREALKNGEKALGRDHPNVATWLNNLANLLRDTGRPEEAELLFREAIEIDEKTYGRDHPEVATDLSNLATLLRTTGRPEEAESLFREALAIFEAHLGIDHPNTSVVARHLESLLKELGHAEEASELRAKYGLDDAE